MPLVSSSLCGIFFSSEKQEVVGQVIFGQHLKLPMTSVAVIGSGTMGNGIAHVFAQHDYRVSLIDISEAALSKALNTIQKNLTRQVEKEVITADIKDRALANIKVNTNLQPGLTDAELIIEAATENLELKLKIFQDLDTFANPGAILASNTSSISITKIAVWFMRTFGFCTCAFEAQETNRIDPRRKAATDFIP